MEVKPGYKQTDVGVIPEEWEVMPFIRAVGLYIDYRGRTPRKLGLSWGDGDILALSANNVQMGRIDPDKEAYLGSEKLYRKWMVQGECEPGDVLLTMEAPLGNVAQIPDSKKYILSQRVLLIRPKAWLHRGFLAHYMKGFFFQQQLSLNSTGSTAKGIQRRKLDNLPIGLPRAKAEQEAIAKALSDADALVESMELMLAKKRWLKQGATQELLAGKKRLPGFSGEWETKLLGDCFALVSTRNAELNDNVVTISAQQGLVRQEEFFKKRVASLVLENYYLIERGHFAYNRSYSNGYPYGAIKRLRRYDKGVVTTLYICFSLKPEAASDPTFFEHYFEAGLLNSGLSTVTNEGGRAHGLLNITKADFLSREIRRPPLVEQTAIATILSDMDAEIAALEAKVVKARQLKQGMMQELLTGRIRLI